jgi:hypothetical protein
MFDIIYDFILNEFIATATTNVYSAQLALLLTHITLWLLYILMVRFVIWTFNVFRGITSW